jgi:hypothetical protein
METCETCQQFKLPGLGCGELPPCNYIAELRVDWQTLQFHSSTATESQTTLAEIVRINIKTSAHVATKLTHTLLDIPARSLSYMKMLNSFVKLFDSWYLLIALKRFKSCLTIYNPMPLLTECSKQSETPTCEYTTSNRVN